MSIDRDTAQSWAGEFKLRPDEPLRRGDLLYDPIKGIELTIKDRGHARDKLTDYETITGLIEGNRKITLLNCFDTEVRWSSQADQFQRRRIVVNVAIFGLDDVTPTATRFSAVRFASPNLTLWVGTKGPNVETKVRGKVTIEWKPPKQSASSVDDIRKLEFFCGYTYGKSLKAGSLDFKILPSLTLKYRRRQSWETVAHDTYCMEMLLCFLTRYWLGPSQIGLISSASRRRLSGDKPKYYHEPHDVLISQHWYRKEEEGNWPLINFQLYGNRIGEFYQRWLEQASVFNRAMALLRAAEEHSVGIETRFLLLSQAAEFLHRETKGGSLLSKKRFGEVAESLRDTLPTNLPKEAVETLSQKIKFMNELGLRRRLKELFRAIRGRPTFLPDYKATAGRVAEYRNAFTHHTKIDRSEAEWAPEVARLSEVLIGTIELYICRLLGLADDDITSLLSHYRINRRFAAYR